jgi:hypothetical protein
VEAAALGCYLTDDVSKPGSVSAGR